MDAQLGNTMTTKTGAYRYAAVALPAADFRAGSRSPQTAAFLSMVMDRLQTLEQKCNVQQRDIAALIKESD